MEHIGSILKRLLKDRNTFERKYKQMVKGDKDDRNVDTNRKSDDRKKDNK